MDHHPRVLQLRVEPAAVGRGEAEPLEGVRREDHHRDEEGDGDEEHDRHVRHQLAVLPPVHEHRDRGEARQDDRPEEERALLARVERRPGVEDREVPARVGGDVLDREVVRQERAHQRRGGDRQQPPHHVHRALRAQRQLGAAGLPRQDPDHAPVHPDQERDPQRDVAEVRHLRCAPARLRTGNRTSPAASWRGRRRRTAAAPPPPRPPRP